MADPITPEDSSYSLGNPNINSVADASIGSSDTARVYGRQISSGNIRGNQNITGILTIIDDQSNSPTIVLSGTDQTISVGSSGNPVISISGADETFIVTDATTKLNQIIIGKLPDGTFGMVVSKPGVDVLTIFT